PSSIPSPTPLKSIMLDPPKVTEAIKMTLDQFTEHLIYHALYERRGSAPKISSLKSFVIPKEPLSQEKLMAQLKEMKRLTDLKAEKEKSEKADQLPITKISYVVNPNKEATMKITRCDNLLNLIVHPNFRLKMIAKFQWVIDQAKKLGLPPPPALATFRMTAEYKKRKRK
ncbi:hypothetical protein Tco_1411989, partial [Tanacetum coccineum]